MRNIFEKYVEICKSLKCTSDQGPSNHCGHSCILQDLSVIGFCFVQLLSDTLIRVPFATSWTQYTSLVCLPPPHFRLQWVQTSIIQLILKIYLLIEEKVTKTLVENQCRLTKAGISEYCIRRYAVVDALMGRIGFRRLAL